ncbi:MAG: bifunctional 2',3'-cyclic-nucleotide 2'-phosphodiesterase/3'-nucleotidase, partial [Rhizobiaceae bacterium]
MSTTQFPVSRRSFLTGVAATGIIALHPFSARAQAKQAHLRIMETTDVHVNVLPYDYYADKPNDTMGLARTATLIDAVRKEATNAMLVDNGDFLQGNPMGDYIAYEKGMKDGDVHPVIKGMNLLAYECSTLGNHEFNYGLSFMDKVLAGANYPFVCANLVKGTELAANPRDDKLYLKPYIILEKKIKDGAGAELPIKVGIIGFVPPQIMMWDAKNLTGNVLTRDIVQAAKAWVPQMKEDGADIVIALSHSGIDIKPGEMMENASFHLAAVEGIDAVFTGHQHLVFPGPKDFVGLEGVDAEKGLLNGKPAVMGGFWGSHMGLIDLLLEQDGNKWKVVSATSEARPIWKREEKEVDGKKTNVTVATVQSFPEVEAALKEDHEATLAYVRRPVGKTSAPLYSYFALVADDPSVQIVSQAQTWYIKDMLKETEFKDLPILSAAAPFKAGGRGGADYYTDVPAGDVAI